jgi:hypothetical protein
MKVHSLRFFKNHFYIGQLRGNSKLSRRGFFYRYKKNGLSYEKNLTIIRDLSKKLSPTLLGKFLRAHSSVGRAAHF